MQQLIKLLLLSVLLCLLPAGSFAQKSTRRTRRPSPSPIICNLASVPNGMVVVGYKRNSACSDGFELLVRRPENGDIICAGSPLPSEFSIATEAQGNSVGTCRNGAFLISTASQGSAKLVKDDPIGRAFASRASDIQVEGEGTVSRLLADDLDGSRHQRFIVELASGQTLLISHNIDLAPRIDRLEVGDSVRFNGEYVWNEKGGVIHWTHHDPRGKHVAGWVIHNGKTYK
jgi:Protein of unknown function (DUF3465)